MIVFEIPIVVILLGIVTDVSDVHLLNAETASDRVIIKTVIVVVTKY